jgi:hypothetical protein
MRARFVGDWQGVYYGIEVRPGAVVDIPPELEWRARHNGHLFEIVSGVTAPEAPRKRGRPRKTDADAS